MKHFIPGEEIHRGFLRGGEWVKYEEDTKLKMCRAKEAGIVIVFLNKEHFEDLDSIKELLDSLKR